MGWAFYKNHEGRECGYGVEATCDYPGCEEVIDRGLGYICGTMKAIHGGGVGCGKYFCPKHGGNVFLIRDGNLAEREYASLCLDCLKKSVGAEPSS